MLIRGNFLLHDHFAGSVMSYHWETNSGFLVLCNKGGERKPFVGLHLLVMMLCFLIWSPVSFDLILDIPNPEPCAPDGSCCHLGSSSGCTTRCVVIFRRVPGEQILFHLPWDELPSDSTGAGDPSFVYLGKKKSCNCFFSLGFTGEKSSDFQAA